MFTHASEAPPGSVPRDDEAQLYGPTWTDALSALGEALQQHAADIDKRFYEGVMRLPKSRHILEALSKPEVERLRAQQTQSLHALAAPDLTAATHRATALRVGRVCAVMGLDQEELIRVWGLVFAAVHRYVDTTAHAEALRVFARRLTRELALQAQAYQCLQSARQDVLLRITRLAWNTESYTDLIRNVIEIIGAHDEVTGCSVGRPDHRGVFRFEAASKNMASFIADIEHSKQLQITATDDDPHGQGSIGRAWRSGRAEHLLSYETDPHGAPWKDVALSKGVRSVVTIPLSEPGRAPMAVLSLYSALAGGFTGADQRAFVELLQTLLAFAVSRIEHLGGHTRTVPIATRQSWATLLRSDALQMHYQPLLDLRTGRVTKVEALARLQEGDRFLAPGEFFPALSSDDFLELYIRGLGQALSHRDRWLKSGIDLKVSVNLPPSALSDVRYFDATQQALQEYRCEPGTLTLEMLETDATLPGLDGARELVKFKALGINLAEDDLGSGHSSLHRLRELPFDWIKIDRSIVSLPGTDALDVLRFIYQLTRLGHSLDKRVVVEGVEGEDLLEAIALLGVDTAQGYWIARPMPAQQVVAWMGNQPGACVSQNPKTPLGKLARLLIWEERLHLISEDQTAFERLEKLFKAAGNAAVPAVSTLAHQDPGCLTCSFTNFFVEMASILENESGDSALPHALITAAMQNGQRSADYRLARRQLIDSIMLGAV
ncbi:EAL domain-containing protein [Paraburkholderia denitrificans]|uniref:EAL domain-containing protein n=1 Tax=Paraburkholderia denitrificans TaxID=694025 RepID=A0ABW0JEV1_9BURK